MQRSALSRTLTVSACPTRSVQPVLPRMTPAEPRQLSIGTRGACNLTDGRASGDALRVIDAPLQSFVRWELIADPASAAAAASTAASDHDAPSSAERVSASPSYRTVRAYLDSRARRLPNCAVGVSVYRSMRRDAETNWRKQSRPPSRAAGEWPNRPAMRRKEGRPAWESGPPDGDKRRQLASFPRWAMRPPPGAPRPPDAKSYRHAALVRLTLSRYDPKPTSVVRCFPARKPLS
jgi:hypothetical protein